jgi:hypothetical protein
LLCSPATAQQVDPAALVLQSRNAYFDCVLESVMAQFQQMPVGVRSNADYSFLGEQGFLACATEERVLGMTLTDNNLSPKLVQAVLLGARAQVKRVIRDIVANPEKYAGFPKPQTTTSGIEGSGETGGYLVQISSQRSELDAKTSYQALQHKFPLLLGNRLPLIKRADLGADRIYFRALVGPFGTPDEASQFCGSLKTAGGQCVVQRN